MAATLGVNVRTIARWEAMESPNTNPFFKFVWLSTSRYSNRLCRYARALLPAGYIEDVRRSPYERSVYIGPEAVVLAMSDETKKSWGVFRYAEGMSVVAISAPSIRTLMADNYAVMDEICMRGDSSQIVNFVTAEAPKGSTPPLWRQHAMHAPFPGIFDMQSTPISESTFLSTAPKFWISAALEPRTGGVVGDVRGAAE